jgi:hypothetical protein
MQMNLFLLKKELYKIHTPFFSKMKLARIPLVQTIIKKSFSKEVYAKGIGLIYKEFIRWTYQPPTAVNKYFQEGSFGIKLNLIDYK